MEATPEADMELEAIADKWAGNFLQWRDYSSGLHSDPERSYGEYVPDLNNWLIAYTDRGNQSTCVDESNAAYIAKQLAPFMEGEDPDVIEYRDSHWAVGSLDGYRIRVRRNGQITDAFKVWAEIQQRKDEYPILDSEDHSQRIEEETAKNIRSIGSRWVAAEVRDGWEWEVLHWLRNNGYEADVEDRDDQGGYPSDEAVQVAQRTLGISEDLHGKEYGSAAYRRMVKRIRAAAKREKFEYEKVNDRRVSGLPSYRYSHTLGHSVKVPAEKLSYRKRNKRAARGAAQSTQHHFKSHW